jgi:hypothetical protein
MQRWALLGDLVEALGEDVELAVHGQELDLRVRPRVPPGLACEVSFQAAQA